MTVINFAKVSRDRARPSSAQPTARPIHKETVQSPLDSTSPQIDVRVTVRPTHADGILISV